MSKTRVVKLTNAKRWPHHGETSNDNGEFPSWAKWRGKRIKIFTERVMPWGWTCKSRYVYRVCKESSNKIAPGSLHDGMSYFVCEHQVQLKPHKHTTGVRANGTPRKSASRQVIHCKKGGFR